jgi:hypothetical protein
MPWNGGDIGAKKPLIFDFHLYSKQPSQMCWARNRGPNNINHLAQILLSVVLLTGDAILLMQYNRDG